MAILWFPTASTEPLPAWALPVELLAVRRLAKCGLKVASTSVIDLRSLDGYKL